MSTSSEKQLDDDDKFLIEMMVRKKKSVKDIAIKLRQKESIIQAHLDHDKKAKNQGNEQGQNDNKDETETFVAEAKFGVQGAEGISMECEALQQNAICQIKFHNKSNWSASGSLVNLHGRAGLLTTHRVLPTKEACTSAQAIFEKDGVDYPVQLTADNYYWTDEQYDATFVSCDHQRLFENHIQAIDPSMFDYVNVGSPLSMYYFTQGLEKGQQTFKTTIKKPKSFGYLGSKTAQNTHGSAVFCGGKLVGVHHGEIRTLKEGGCNASVNEAISIKAIEKWIGEARKNLFSPGDKVLAQWTDGHKYNAKILCKTERGYRVNYYEFGPDEEEDLAISKILATVIKTPYLMDLGSGEDLKEIESKEESKPDLSELDQDDRDMIQGLLENSTSIDVIAIKLHKDGKLIQAFVDSLNATSDVKEWLEKLGIDKYTDKFMSEGYNSLKMIQSLNSTQVEEMFTRIGMGPGSRVKIQNSLDKETKVAPFVSTLESLENTPMAQGWVPKSNNLTSQFQRKNGTCSVRQTCEIIRRDYKHNSGALPEIFYVKSTNHNLFFKIQVAYTKSSK